MFRKLKLKKNIFCRILKEWGNDITFPYDYFQNENYFQEDLETTKSHLIVNWDLDENDLHEYEIFKVFYTFFKYLYIYFFYITKGEQLQKKTPRS